MFFDFDKFRSIIFSGMKISPEGIPLIVGLKELGYHTYPVTVALYGLYQYQLFEREMDEQYLDASLTCGKWLLKNGEKTPKKILWRHNFPNRFLKMDPGWICGLTQAMGSALFLYLKEFDETFGEYDKMALEPLFHHVSNGGLVNSIGDTDIYFS